MSELRLPQAYCFWLMHQAAQSQPKTSWSASQSNIVTIETSLDFWRLFNCIHSPSKLSHADYSLFRAGVSPAWEDPACKDGGRWIVKAATDEMLMEVLAAMVCGEFSEDVLGAVFSARRGGMKLALWLSTSEEDKVMTIGKKFKQVVHESIKAPSSEVTFESFAHTGETLLKL